MAGAAAVSRSGRPPATAPAGRVTLVAAARAQGLSRSHAHTLVTRGKVPARREPDGTWTVAEADVPLLVRRQPSAAARKAVQLRPDPVQLKAWAAATKRAGHVAVSSWLSRVADAAAKR